MVVYKKWTQKGVFAVLGVCVLVMVIYVLQQTISRHTVVHVKATESDTDIRPLYFIAYSSDMESTTTCTAAKDIDWNKAIYALSNYMENGSGFSNKEDIGAAEIQRNFDENCKRDISIYKKFTYK